MTTTKQHLRQALLLGLLLFIPALSMAAGQVDSLGAVATTLSGNTDPLFGLLSGFSYVCGAWFAFKSALLLRDHTDNQQQVKLSKPLTAFVVSALLFTMPSFLKMMTETFFGSTAMMAIGTLAAGKPPQSDPATMGTMFVALSYSLPAIIVLIGIMSRLAGIFLLLRCLFMLPQLEQGRETASKIIWIAIAGVGLLTFPSMADTIANSMGASSGGAPNPLTAAYAPPSGNDFNSAIASVLMFVQLLGVIAFFRGMLIFKAIGENKDGAMGRALTHIFGGSAAMNISWTVAMLATSIGAKAQICGIAAGIICAF